MRSAADLPDDIDELKGRLIAAEAGLLAKTLEAEKLKFELARLRRMSFGQSSERIERAIEQLELKLEEIETTAAGEAVAALSQPDPTRPASPEKKPRRKLPEHLPRREERHEPATSDCPRCGSERPRKVGEDVTEVLEYVPGRFGDRNQRRRACRSRPGGRVEGGPRTSTRSRARARWHRHGARDRHRRHWRLCHRFALGARVGRPHVAHDLAVVRTDGRAGREALDDQAASGVEPEGRLSSTPDTAANLDCPSWLYPKLFLRETAMSAATGRSPSGRVVKDQEPRKSGTAGTLKCHPLGAELLSYAVDAETFDTPDAVLDHLHEITWRYCRLSVLGAGLFPLKWGDLRGVEKGRTVFLHKSVPKGWWEDYLELRRKNLDVGTMMARLTLAPYTWTESRRMLEPLGIDRWPYELALKYGMRDGLMCPVGGRWVVGYWSRSVLSKTLAPQVRVMLFMGANFAAIRLQQLLGHNANRFGKRASLTPRELSVLRCQSVGKRVKETAERLELGEETIRSHMKKAAAKLGVHDRTHAVAQALRLHLIP